MGITGFSPPFPWRIRRGLRSFQPHPSHPNHGISGKAIFPRTWMSQPLLPHPWKFRENRAGCRESHSRPFRPQFPPRSHIWDAGNAHPDPKTWDLRLGVLGAAGIFGMRCLDWESWERRSRISIPAHGRGSLGSIPEDPSRSQRIPVDPCPSPAFQDLWDGLDPAGSCWRFTGHTFSG